ncbi:MAG: N-acetylmuramoyl-L-alanine amidase, partial [Actinobacteria bacterium]|nr:N-acetylmuramoyl-L-alanine amidase [Actinomycetota bacterium]
MRRARLAAVPLALLTLAAACSSTAPKPAPTSSSVASSASSLAASTARASSPARPRSSTARPRPTVPSQSSAPRPTPPPSSSATSTGVTVVLNPGHNGGNAADPAAINRQVPAGFGEYKACDTTGTNTDAGYTEHAFNWDVALRVRAILVAHGIRVVMTRPNDTGIGPCVDQRAAIGNQPDVAAVVSIHADGAPASGHGFHVNQDSQRPDGATAAVAGDSIKLGEAIHAALVRSSGLVPSTYIGQDGYYYRSDLVKTPPTT